MIQAILDNVALPATLSIEEERKLIDGLNDQVWKTVWQGNWPHLTTLAIDARARAIRIGYKRGEASALLSLGQLERLRSDQTKALAFYEEAKVLFHELQDVEGMAKVYQQIGLLHFHLGAFEWAVECTLESRELYTKLAHTSGIASTYTTVGNIYAALEQFDTAEEQFDEALRLYKNCKDERGLSRTLANVARVTEARGNFTRSIEIQREAIATLKTLDQTINICAAMLNLGGCYAKNGDHELSLDTLTEALEIADTNGYTRAQCVGRLFLADLYLRMEQTELARTVFDRAKQYSIYEDLADVRILSDEFEAELCAKEGNFERAYQLEHSSAEQSKKLYSAQTQKAVAIKHTQNKFEQARREQLILAEKNAELLALSEQKDEMLRIVSHDMRNPLGFIIGMANLLRTEPDDDIESIKTIGGSIEEAGQRLLVLVNNLLNVARFEEGAIKIEKRPTGIEDMLSETRKLFEPLAKNKNVSLSFNTEAAVGSVSIDEPKMQQVVGNILSNALKFTPYGGSIKVNASRELGSLAITVQDSGIGIDADHMNDLFVKFSPHRRTGTNGENGIGLGMTIIKHFVELHGGTVSVTSTADTGTTVSIAVPE